MFFVGKPVVVTHSRGRGVKERPGTHVEFEREHYRKRAIERNMKKTGNNFYRKLMYINLLYKNNFQNCD